MLPVTLADGGIATGVGPFASAVGLVVALFAVIFATLAFQAAARRSNRSLAWVGFAFLIFAAKNVFTALTVTSHVVPHDVIELALTISDLAIMLLLFAPFIIRRTA